MIRLRRTEPPAPEPRFVRSCVVYVEIASRRMIVAVQDRVGGMLSERHDAATLLDDRLDLEPAGNAVRLALSQCQQLPMQDFSGSKRSDWTAYRASKLRSIREFERRWRRIQVLGANEYNISWMVESCIGNTRGLTLGGEISAFNPSGLAELINYVHEQERRFAELR